MAAPITHDEAQRRLHRVGRRAVKAVQAASRADSNGGLKRWLTTAAEWLSVGDRRAGVSRPWPGLASQVTNIAREVE